MRDSAPPDQARPDDSDALIEQAHTGDATAFGELVSLHQPALFQFVNGKINNPHDSEDLCQTVWLQAWSGLAAFRGDSSFRTWLFAIAKHAIAHFYQDRARSPVGPDPAWESVAESAESLLTTPEAPHRIFHARQSAAACLCCLAASLPLDQQVAVILSDLYGCNDREIAKSIRVSVARLKHLLHTARASMDQSSGTACAFVRKTGDPDCCHGRKVKARRCEGRRPSLCCAASPTAYPPANTAQKPCGQKPNHQNRRRPATYQELLSLRSKFLHDIDLLLSRITFS